MRKQHEDKLLGEVEVKEEEAKVDAVLVCPERDQHKSRLNQVCTGCGETIPGGGMYSPDVFDKYFRLGPDISPPVHRHPYSEAESEGWLEYSRLNDEYVAAAFLVDDLRRDRAQIVGRYTDRSGNTQTDDTVYRRGAVADERIAAAIARREKLRELAGEKLLEINRLGQVRTARIVGDLYAESYPPAPPQPSLLERAASALKG